MRKYKLSMLFLAAFLLVTVTRCKDSGDMQSGTDEEVQSSGDETAGGEFLDTSGVKRNESAFRTGSAVSDAYVEPSNLEEYEVKAKDFVYEYENLTYELVWSDEFDYEGLPDDTKWGYDVGGSGWGNNELQYYTKDGNATVSEGFFTIEARKEEHGGKDYTSARLITKNKADFLYGKFEIRAKLPTGRGTWPAIWMLPTDWSYGSWPASGEIDIMEHVGYDQDKIHASIHTQSYYHKVGTQKTGTKVIKGVSEEFHVYSVEWLPDKIMAYIDGELYFTFEPAKYKTTPSYKEWPFDKRMHLLLNIAVGGDWGGAKGVDEEVFPQTMVVDYVRVYQSPEINTIMEK